MISIAVDRAKYVELNLRDVTPAVCLRHLNALVSRHPHLVEPVTPVRDFDLARYSFVESVDVVASLDSRPDLTKMTPTEFEHFVRQLFEARGLEGWTTKRTGDDGVDAVVTNPDPMIGGLTIVQAKKYNGVIGVSHIRELVGAMDEKRAGRGILITTSWFASGCWNKATRKQSYRADRRRPTSLSGQRTSEHRCPRGTAISACPGLAAIDNSSDCIERSDASLVCSKMSVLAENMNS